MIVEIVPDIFTANQRVAEGKNGIIIGARAALAVDTGNDVHDGGAMADFIRAQGHAPVRLVLTHGHGDHILGTTAFPDAEIFAHAGTPAVMRRELNRLAERQGELVATMMARVRFPTVTFSDQLEIDLGGLQVRAFPTPGHSADGVSLYVVERRVLFAGDTVVTGIVPAIADGDSRTMVASLRALADMAIDTLVPGHGRILQGQDAVRDWIRWQTGYLVGVNAAAREAVDRGESDATIVDSITYDRFISDRLPRDRHRMEWRHHNTVQKIITEIRQNLAQEGADP